jgi:hypothetical protein
MRIVIATWIVACACVAEDVSGPPDDELAAPLSAGASCVPWADHWAFWGECSGDVPLAAGTEVRSLSAGQVVQVYPSCGGWAGRSVRVDHGDGRYMYAHLDAAVAVAVGDWVVPGTRIGRVYGGAGPVYCNASLTTCGLGWSAARPQLCWSGPHLHREGRCCTADDCGSGHATVGAIRAKWEALGGCGWASPETDELAAAAGGRFNHFTGGASIYWTPWTGAHEVHGRIRDHWEWLGWEWSWLGYPVTDEYAYDGSPWGMPGWVAESEFEGGWLSYAFATGQIFEWVK